MLSIPLGISTRIYLGNVIDAKRRQPILLHFFDIVAGNRVSTLSNESGPLDAHLIRHHVGVSRRYEQVGVRLVGLAGNPLISLSKSLGIGEEAGVQHVELLPLLFHRSPDSFEDRSVDLHPVFDHSLVSRCGSVLPRILSHQRLGRPRQPISVLNDKAEHLEEDVADGDLGPADERLSNVISGSLDDLIFAWRPRVDARLHFSACSSKPTTQHIRSTGVKNLIDSRINSFVERPQKDAEPHIINSSIRSRYEAIFGVRLDRPDIKYLPRVISLHILHPVTPRHDSKDRSRSGLLKADIRFGVSVAIQVEIAVLLQAGEGGVLIAL